MTIYPAHSEQHLANVRLLFEEYAMAFSNNICFQGFQEELSGLPGAYAPPTGTLLLAEKEGVLAGCVALRLLGGGACEMKRLYVRPAFRGQHIGRALAEAIIAAAVQLGYSLMRLDTLFEMERARALYRSLGFQETAAYNQNTYDRVHFMARALDVPLKTTRQ